MDDIHLGLVPMSKPKVIFQSVQIKSNSVQPKSPSMQVSEIAKEIFTALWTEKFLEIMLLSL